MITHEESLENFKDQLQYALDHYTSHGIKPEEIDHIVMGVESKKQLEENTIVLNEEMNQKIIDLVLTINVKNKNLLNPVNWN